MERLASRSAGTGRWVASILREAFPPVRREARDRPDRAGSSQALQIVGDGAGVLVAELGIGGHAHAGLGLVRRADEGGDIFGGQARSGGGSRGSDLRYTLELDLEDAVAPDAKSSARAFSYHGAEWLSLYWHNSVRKSQY